MKTFVLALVCSVMSLTACHKQAGNDEEIVDTTLNDPVGAPQLSSNTMNVDENLTTISTGSPVHGATTVTQEQQLGTMDYDEDSSEERAREDAGTTGAQSARGDLRTLFSSDDYPASAQAAGAEGTAVAVLTVGPDGRVVDCTLVQSTGNDALDSATCNILRRRAIFTPARDSSGNATTATVTTPPISWRLQE